MEEERNDSTLPCSLSSSPSVSKPRKYNGAPLYHRPVIMKMIVPLFVSSSVLLFPSIALWPDTHISIITICLWLICLKYSAFRVSKSTVTYSKRLYTNAPSELRANREEAHCLHSSNGSTFEIYFTGIVRLLLQSLFEIHQYRRQVQDITIFVLLLI